MRVSSLSLRGVLALPAVATSVATASFSRADDLERADAAAHCDRVTFSVSLDAHSPATTHLVGDLCLPDARRGRTLQLLVHGATYNRSYWEFPYEPRLYSYARVANEAGFATLAIDRLGAGESDHPDGSLVTTASSAYTLHQVVQQLRSGALSGENGEPLDFDKIVIVGHSLGTLITWAEAGTYTDVDAVVVTGAGHGGPTPATVVLESNFYAAQLDPRFASAGLPQGYMTTKPGARSLFYYTPNADPNVIAFDEATKDVFGTGIFTDFATAYAATSNIHVPVLGVFGDYDGLSCNQTPCSTTGGLAGESQYYPPDAGYTQIFIPYAGHDLTLHRNAPLFAWTVQAWLIGRLGGWREDCGTHELPR